MERRHPSIIPSMRYRNAPAAIEWLCSTFGFEAHLVVPSDDGGIRHAQLVYGNGMIMLGSVRDDEVGGSIKPPAELGGVGTQGSYVIVPDIEDHYARVVAAGAEIVLDLEEQEHGGKLYSCRDPEGHAWNFGSYDPWAPV